MTVTPTDERAFYEKVQRVTAYRALRGLKIPASVIADLGRGDAETAVATLSSIASQGSNDANINRYWSASADTINDLFLNRTQQLALDGKRQLAYLVKKHGAA